MMTKRMVSSINPKMSCINKHGGALPTTVHIITQLCVRFWCLNSEFVDFLVNRAYDQLYRELNGCIPASKHTKGRHPIKTGSLMREYVSFLVIIQRIKHVSNDNC